MLFFCVLFFFFLSKERVAQEGDSGGGRGKRCERGEGERGKGRGREGVREGIKRDL